MDTIKKEEYDKNMKKEQARKKKIWLEALADKKIAGNVLAAVDRTGYSKSTMYNYKKIDTKFSKDWDNVVLEAQDNFKEEAEYALRASVLSGNITAIIFTLKNLDPKKWRDRKEVTGEDGKPIQMEVPGLTQFLKENAAKFVK